MKRKKNDILEMKMLLLKNMFQERTSNQGSLYNSKFNLPFRALGINLSRVEPNLYS